ncbi:MAG: MBL fold metallo-hydrolase [Chloroflexi bacterium]|nr:MBL fold metallo-hydrolase [Chloroflexota bacterium]
MASKTTIDGLELTRYVQASFKVKGGGLVVFVDPHRITDKEVGAEKADIILSTHPHGDHMDPAAMKACAKADTIIVTNPAVAAQLPADVKSKWKVVAIRAGESTTQKGVFIKAVAGYNQYHPKEQGFNTGFVFTLGGKTLFHGGDTGKCPEMGQMGKVDIALVPIGGTYTMDEKEAAEAVREWIKPKWAIPMHYGYATGGDPEKFKSLVGPGVTVQVLEPVLNIKWGG